MIFWAKHQLFDFLRIIGIRDRLRCPYCKAVGTWKPHGGWLDFGDKERRRWLCKWCGAGRDFDGIFAARYSEEKRCWVRWERGEGPATYYILERWTPECVINQSQLFRCNPWRG